MRKMMRRRRWRKRIRRSAGKAFSSKRYYSEVVRFAETLLLLQMVQQW
jgi:hypothetical protein